MYAVFMMARPLRIGIAGIAAALVVAGILLLLYRPSGGEGYDLEGRRVLVVVFEGFQPLELNPVREYLSECGARVAILSLHEDVGISYDLYIWDYEDRLGELAEGYDAVVIIGGPGVYRRVTGGHYPEVELLEELVKEFNRRGRLVAAICAAPAVLARAGILKGVKATCYPSEAIIKILEEGGAQHVDEGVVAYGNIVTARGPPEARDFAKAIAEKLAGGS